MLPADRHASAPVARVRSPRTGAAAPTATSSISEGLLSQETVPSERGPSMVVQSEVLLVASKASTASESLHGEAEPVDSEPSLMRPSSLPVPCLVPVTTQPPSPDSLTSSSPSGGTAASSVGSAVDSTRVVGKAASPPGTPGSGPGSRPETVGDDRTSLPSRTRPPSPLGPGTTTRPPRPVPAMPSLARDPRARPLPPSVEGARADGNSAEAATDSTNRLGPDRTTESGPFTAASATRPLPRDATAARAPACGEGQRARE